jgi:hypothetical protein
MQSKNRRGELLDLYGTKTVYEGARLAGERYLIWFGSENSKQGHRTTYRSLRKAVRVARGYQRGGYYVKITDRLIY